MAEEVAGLVFYQFVKMFLLPADGCLISRKLVFHEVAGKYFASPADAKIFRVQENFKTFQGKVQTFSRHLDVALFQCPEPEKCIPSHFSLRGIKIFCLILVEESFCQSLWLIVYFFYITAHSLFSHGADYPVGRVGEIEIYVFCHGLSVRIYLNIFGGGTVQGECFPKQESGSQTPFPVAWLSVLQGFFLPLAA